MVPDENAARELISGVRKPDTQRGLRGEIPTHGVALFRSLAYDASVPPVGNCGEWATPQRPPAGHFFHFVSLLFLLPHYATHGDYRTQIWYDPPSSTPGFRPSASRWRKLPQVRVT